MRTITQAKIEGRTMLWVSWGDGTASRIDLTPVLAKDGVFAYLVDPVRLAAVAVGERGRSVVWKDQDGEDIDLCADALWLMAHPNEVAA